MSSRISSAEPEKLLRYADRGGQIAQKLLSTALHLLGTLQRFASTCTEYEVGVAYLPDGLRNLAQGANTVDEWVRQVGIKFLMADRLGSILRPLPIWPGWPRVGVPEWWWRIPWPWPIRVIILPPTLLSPPWLQFPSPPVLRPQPTPAPTPTPKLPTKPKPVQPVGPWDKYTVSGGGYPTYGDGTLHPGIDIVPDPYDPHKTYPVHPIGPGVVERVAQDQNGYGYYIVIKHRLSDGRTVYTLYAHLASRPSLKEGTVVGTDTELGQMGSTGRSTGPHLHLEVRLNENPRIGDYYYNTPDTIIKSADGTERRAGDAMDEDFIDPRAVIDGTVGWQFEEPQKEPLSYLA